jgi:hypothetical protein
VGVETGGSVGGDWDHDPVVALVGDRLAECVPVRAAALDPRVNGDPEPCRALLDRLLERDGDR